MSRYIQHYQTYEKTGIILEKINRFLTDSGYAREIYDGEHVYKKGDGWFSAPKFIKIVNIGGNRIEIQAWVKWALLPGIFIGELNHTENTFIAAIDKSKISTIVRVINEIVMHNINATNNMNNNAQAQQANNGAYYNGAQAQQVNNGAYYNNAQAQQANNGAYYNNAQAQQVNSGAYYNNAQAQQVNNGAYYNNAQAQQVNNGAYYNNAQTQQANNQFDVDGSWENPYKNSSQPKVDPTGVTLKEFIEKYASQNIRREIKSAAITGYVCSAITIILGIALVNIIGILLGIVITALVLGFHLAKSKACAIAWLVIVCLDCLVSIILAGALSGWIMIIAGVWAVKVLNSAEKEYNAFKCGF